MNIKLLILIAAFILSLVGISCFGGPVPYLFFFFVLSIPIASYLYLFFVMASLRIYQKPDGRNMVAGSPSDLLVTLHNESPFSFSSLRVICYSSFSSLSGIEDSTVWELPPHSSIRMQTQLVCRYRGEYKVGIKQIVAGDLLGIFTLTYKIAEPLSVIVAPAMIRLAELREEDPLPDADRDSYANRSEPDIPVREYVPGDDVRFLNWKAVAAMQKLMVRERIGEEKSGIVLILEPKRSGAREEDYLPPENKVLECLLALGLYYVEHNIPVDVIFHADGVQKLPLRGPGDYERLYAAMLSYSFREDAELKELLAEHGALAGYSCLIPIVRRFAAEDLEWLQELNVEHAPVRVCLIEDAAVKAAVPAANARKAAHNNSVLKQSVATALKAGQLEAAAKTDRSPSLSKSGSSTAAEPGYGVRILRIGAEQAPGEVL
ncbi:MAG: DUF58 domain-containing protein [Lachnospiraceae bacterium]|nr:DUF58 domain-containing protein [Lachnospiraceae bacterium]